MTIVLNHTPYQVTVFSADSASSFIVSDFGPIKSAFKGRGVLFAWVEGGEPRAPWSMQFSLSGAVQTGYAGADPRVISATLASSDKFPCSGFVSEDNQGYLIAPAVRLESQGGKELVLMLVSPALTPRRVYADKMFLSAPSDAGILNLSIGDDEVRCFGLFPRGSKSAKIILNRNPGLPAYREGFDQTLCSVKEPGEVKALWKPVARNFEERILAFDPFHPKPAIYDDLVDSLDATDEDGMRENYVVGDGVGVTYRLRLELDRGLGRHSTDEALLTVT